MAANTGQRIARPMPLAKVSASSSGALIASKATTLQISSATPATQICVTMKYWRRSRMSAIAPLGTPSRNTGAVEADCTSATITGETDSEVISHAAATSFIHMQVLAVTQTPHSVRNTGCDKGVQADTGAMTALRSPAETSLMPVNLSPDSALPGKQSPQCAPCERWCGCRPGSSRALDARGAQPMRGGVTTG